MRGETKSNAESRIFKIDRYLLTKIYGAGALTHEKKRNSNGGAQCRAGKAYRFGAHLICMLSLAACQLGTTEEQKLEQRAKEALARVLKDPHSAQYQNLKVIADMDSVCGEVNSKNSFGAYTGFRGFFMGPDGVAWVEGADGGGYELLSSICR